MATTAKKTISSKRNVKSRIMVIHHGGNQGLRTEIYKNTTIDEYKDLNIEMGMELLDSYKTNGKKCYRFVHYVRWQGDGKFIPSYVIVVEL